MGGTWRSAAAVTRVLGSGIDFGRSELSNGQSCIYVSAVGDTAMDKGAFVGFESGSVKY